MKKFLVLYRAPLSALAQTMNATPEQMAKGMEAWQQWATKCGDQLVDIGTPLHNGIQLNQEGAAESQTQVCGYSVLQGNDMDEVKGLMDGHPHIGWHPEANIEIYEAMPMPGM